MSPSQASTRIKALASDLGFCRVGIAPAGPSSRADYYRRWLAAGHHGGMAYLARHLHTRFDPGRILAGARSMIVAAHPYRQPPPDRSHRVPAPVVAHPAAGPVPNGGPTGDPTGGGLGCGAPGDPAPARGRVAMYAWGRDYHKVVKNRLRELCRRLRAEVPYSFESRVCVDTAPIVERDLAAVAGVGWIGKNTMVIAPQAGSYFFLGVVATTLALATDTPLPDHCGTCTRCLDACPTGALAAPYEMDASRCISYLTIEHREAVSEELHGAMGDWVFGCDICQEVCPHNGKSQLEADRAYAVRPPGPFPSLVEWLQWDEAEYRAAVRGSAVKRATFAMLQRNAAIALRNLGGSPP